MEKVAESIEEGDTDGRPRDYANRLSLKVLASCKKNTSLYWSASTSTKDIALVTGNCYREAQNTCGPGPNKYFDPVGSFSILICGPAQSSFEVV